MKIAAVLTGLALALSLATASQAATSAPKKVVQAQAATQPWSVCFDISIARGFDHEYEEWRQFIAECMAGRIPLK